LINNKRVLAIIPARGGSKRLPRKNILSIAGKPLIDWTIEAALSSEYVDEVYVSTDDQEIAGIASKHNISIPELRPRALSSDYASTQDVIFYTLENFGNEADIIVILQPTSPLRVAEQIDGAIKLFEKNNAFSVVSVTLCLMGVHTVLLIQLKMHYFFQTT
jgi:N-acylneuraminate cytidylyltransferase